ncbi:Phage lysin, glycosyl hydrolase, family 25 [Streptococcus sp. DD10]|nr:Phage lysin, glycosyl hydrolase, family 25 [Streptococcus sp. DD10]
MVLAFFASFILLILSSRFITSIQTRANENQTKQNSSSSSASSNTSSSSTVASITSTTINGVFRPIIDVSGWQLPSEIDYDTLSNEISGAIIRVHSGAQTTKENAAAHLNGLDKAYETHLKEFKKRNIPVAVYAYVAASTKEEMEKEAEEFYKAAKKFNPSYYWLDVEEKTMDDMDAGVEAFRAKLSALGAKNIGIYIGTYFMEEHSINLDKFDAIWFPTYGNDNGYFNAAPQTLEKYDLHQYTSQGYLNGFSYPLDLNQIPSTVDEEKNFQKIFAPQE